MFMEVEVGVSLEIIKGAVAEIANDIEMEERSFEGYFSASNGFFYFEEVEPPSAVAAEGWNVEWQVGVLGAFHCPMQQLEQNWSEIKHLMEEVFKCSSSRFVLSFQFDRVYAFNEGDGVVYKSNMVI
ncbi:hypothetical protein J3P89_24035 [Pseudomonas sp. Z1-14]|uniref:hypothetical protein n=1 Tax=Pseudomonas sp. Z1-14 TaxID=2817409 RepID=UPI003DA8EA56